LWSMLSLYPKQDVRLHLCMCTCMCVCVCASGLVGLWVCLCEACESHLVSADRLHPSLFHPLVSLSLPSLSPPYFRATRARSLPLPCLFDPRRAEATAEAIALSFLLSSENPDDAHHAPQSGTCVHRRDTRHAHTMLALDTHNAHTILAHTDTQTHTHTHTTLTHIATETVIPLCQTLRLSSATSLRHFLRTADHSAPQCVHCVASHSAPIT